MSKKKYEWPGVVYASAEYYRLYREANRQKLLEYSRAYSAERYRTHPVQEQARRKRWASLYPDKAQAHQRVRAAILSGKLVKGSCATCGQLPENTRVVAHHNDYTKPLEVIWYCEQHHKDHHNK